MYSLIRAYGLVLSYVQEQLYLYLIVQNTQVLIVVLRNLDEPFGVLRRDRRRHSCYFRHLNVSETSLDEY
jgi:hypothetical protein